MASRARSRSSRVSKPSVPRCGERPISTISPTRNGNGDRRVLRHDGDPARELAPRVARRAGVRASAPSPRVGRSTRVATRNSVVLPAPLRAGERPAPRPRASARSTPRSTVARRRARRRSRPAKREDGSRAHGAKTRVLVPAQQPQEQRPAGERGDRADRQLAAAEQRARRRVAQHEERRARRAPRRAPAAGGRDRSAAAADAG